MNPAASPFALPETVRGAALDEHFYVGISGGVDSSVAALLLKRQGFQVTGLFMKNWDEDDTDEFCSAAEDLAAAERACAVLDIPLRTVNFAAEYWDRVFEPFIADYARGLTPNPDIGCNREIKFGEFLHYVGDLGGERIATGHYARIERRRGAYVLLKARDESKDQSYFLHALSQRQLARAHFPLGELPKSAVRDIAREHGLANHDRKDSTGICFIGERPFKSFLSRFVALSPGPIETPSGERLGTHDGLPFYTLGQRQGLGIGGVKGGSGEPWYVIDKLAARNALVVAQGHDHPELHTSRLRASRVHWIAPEPPRLPLTCAAKTRYRHREQACRVEAGAEGEVLVAFDAPQWAVTPGQAIVFYAGDECLGGGVIAQRL